MPAPITQAPQNPPNPNGHTVISTVETPDGTMLMCKCQCGKRFTLMAEDPTYDTDTKCVSCTMLGGPKKHEPRVAPEVTKKLRTPPNRVGESKGYVTFTGYRREPGTDKIIWQWECICGFKGENPLSSIHDKKTCRSKRCSNMMNNGLTIDEARKILREGNK